MRKQLFMATRPDPGFRWRGEDVTRLEGLSDAVFGFAITLLVVSLDVPLDFDDLLRDMRGFLAFGICFAYLVHLWFQHYIYFRRYALESTFVVMCNTFLLFVVVMYIYPLKFLAGYLLDGVVGLTAPAAGSDSVAPPIIADDQVGMLMVIYGVGFVAVSGAFLVLYLYAYRQRELLELNALERYDTRESIVAQALKVGIGLIAIAVAYWGGANAGLHSGLVYFLVMIPVLILYGFVSGHKRRQLLVNTHEPDASHVRGAA
ncbi:MAG: DUF1211 domain-containing protein [Anaerolineales bacterium]|nr:DUF1211 domain-containing protein [Anaerolineales bacterium]